MARGSFNPNTAYFASSNPLTGDPLTIACWFNPTSDTGFNNTLVHIHTPSTGYGYFLRIAEGLTNNPIEAWKYGGSGSPRATLSSAVNFGSWNFGAAVYVSDTSRYVYCNGTLSSEDTTSVTDPTVDEMYIGASSIGGSSVSTWFTGNIAEVAIWDTNLSTAELDSLNDGVSPLFIRPGNLVSYFPLVRDHRDYMGNVTLTETSGTLTVENHPKIFKPKRKQINFFTATGDEFFQAVSNSLSLASSLIKKTMFSIDNSLGLSSSVSTILAIVKTISNSLGLSSAVSTVYSVYQAVIGSSSKLHIRRRRKRK